MAELPPSAISRRSGDVEHVPLTMDISLNGSEQGPVTEAELSTLVHSFYAKVRQDQVLGSLFNQAVEDWPEHLEKLTAFWSSVMLTSGRYKGNPMATHLRHKDAIRPSMFARWLELWAETARETLSDHGAAGVISMAERIAQSLQLGLFFRLDSLVTKGG